MRKQITLLLTVFFLFPISLVASDGILLKNHKATLLSTNYLNTENNFMNSASTDYELALMNLQVDILGVLFFGPQISLDFQFDNMIAVGPYLRWNYAGVLYQGVVTDWFSDGSTASPASYGIGVQAKVLFPIGSGQHRPYAGFGYERFRGKDTYDSGDERGEHIWEYKSNIFHFDFGYRMLTDSGFNLSVGLSLGVSNETENIDYYELELALIDYNTLSARFIGMLQLGLGWQIGN